MHVNDVSTFVNFCINSQILSCLAGRAQNNILGHHGDHAPQLMVCEPSSEVMDNRTLNYHQSTGAA